MTERYNLGETDPTNDQLGVADQLLEGADMSTLTGEYRARDGSLSEQVDTAPVDIIDGPEIPQ